MMTLQPQLCCLSCILFVEYVYAAVKPATSLNSRVDRERIHKPCGSHTLRKPQLPPPQLPLPHHSKLADAPGD